MLHTNATTTSTVTGNFCGCSWNWGEYLIWRYRIRPLPLYPGSLLFCSPSCPFCRASIDSSCIAIEPCLDYSCSGMFLPCCPLLLLRPFLSHPVVGSCLLLANEPTLPVLFQLEQALVVEQSSVKRVGPILRSCCCTISCCQKNSFLPQFLFISKQTISFNLSVLLLSSKLSLLLCCQQFLFLPQLLFISNWALLFDLSLPLSSSHSLMASELLLLSWCMIANGIAFVLWEFWRTRVARKFL